MASRRKPHPNSSETKPKNYVAESEILTQAINLENRHIRINCEFAFNPRSVTMMPNPPLTEKPLKENLAALTKEQTKSIAEFDHYLKRELVHFYETPNNKQKYPLTTSQQIGWFANWVS